MKRFALVTGASSGLGRAIAIGLSARRISTLLVALPGEGLDEVCQQCRENGTESICFETDLTDQDALSELVRHISCTYNVFAIFNNAGIGGSRKFEDAPDWYINNILRLNVLATTNITHELLENLKRNSPAYILNISSMAALTPCGYKTVYPASKAYIKQFSLGMREELKEYGISVSLALLGPMPTHKEVIQRIRRQGIIGRILSVSPEKVAERCVRGLFGKERIIVAGRFNEISYHIMKFIPEYFRGILMSRSVRRNELGIKHMAENGKGSCNRG